MKRKKIIIAHSWTDVSINIQTKNVAYKLSEQADVVYFTQARIGKPVLKINEHLTVMEWPNKRPASLKDLFFCIRQIKNIKPDIVIVHFGATKVALLGSWLAGVKNRIAWYHTLAQQMRIESGSKPRAAFNLFIRRITYLFATKVITLNSYAALDAVKDQHIAKRKIEIIANGMDVPVERKEHYHYDNEFFRFLYVGRLTDSKGSQFAVRIFAQLVKKHKNVIFQLVGGGDMEVGLKKIVEELSVTGNIIFEGSTKNYKDVFGYFKSAYALIVPSKIDNYPTVIIEAMACGLPVIGSKVGGIPEMIADGKDGFLCNLEDNEQWIEKIEWLIHNPGKRDEIAVNARNSFESKFAINTHVQKVIDLIDELTVEK